MGWHSEVVPDSRSWRRALVKDVDLRSDELVVLRQALDTAKGRLDGFQGFEALRPLSLAGAGWR